MTGFGMMCFTGAIVAWMFMGVTNQFLIGFCHLIELMPEKVPDLRENLLLLFC